MSPKPRSFDVHRLFFSLANATRVALFDFAAAPTLADAVSTHLTERERLRLEGLGSGRRGREWLAARICLKESLVRSGVIASPRDCEVGQDERGRPRLSLGPEALGAPPPDCALSHGGRWAVSAWTDLPGVKVGVDIEPRSARWAERRRSAVGADDDAAPDLAPSDRAAVLWTLKEAAAKALGTGLAGALDSAVREERGTLCRIEAADGRRSFGRSLIGPGWVLAVAWWNERSSSCRAH
ncbi:MAG: 4'-phosphopantetheinyl transferase superfamily protein [Candidatus Aminicenantes bacterium]|nr:4'-phosphopantetheinyl transferase superfamily protein [Candidatus Aminicenantes bacterium]